MHGKVHIHGSIRPEVLKRILTKGFPYLRNHGGGVGGGGILGIFHEFEIFVEMSEDGFEDSD